MGLLVCFVLLILGMCDAFTVTIGDNDSLYPYVSMISDGSVLTWTRGVNAEFLSTSTAVSVSDRGVRYISTAFTLRGLDDIFDTSFECRLRPGMLCQTPFGDKIFPDRGIVRVGSFPRNEHLATVANTSCVGESHRTISNSGVYDISLCDVMKSSIEVVWAEDRLYVRYQETPLSAFVIVSVCVIALVFVTAQTLASELKDHVRQRNYLLSTVACVFLLLYDVGLYLPWKRYVTHEEFEVFWWIFAYIILNLIGVFQEIVLGSAGKSSTEQGNIPLNAIIGTLLLTAMSIYGTIENVYTAPILVAILTRAVAKMFAYVYCFFGLSGSKMHNWWVCMDWVVIILCYQWGMKAGSLESQEKDLQFVSLFIISFALGKILSDAETQQPKFMSASLLKRDCCNEIKVKLLTADSGGSYDLPFSNLRTRNTSL